MDNAANARHHAASRRPRTILVATTNAGKLREVCAVLSTLPVELLQLGDIPRIEPPEENADTFEENAADKALYYARATGHWTLADDSGLEVDALDGAPGVRSARYAGAAGDDQANNGKLIKALVGVPKERRTARFRCAIALADAERVRASATGLIEGLIVETPRGANGFGYDPHFLVPTHGLTTAEMTPTLKNRVSHRGQALAAILPLIEQLLRDGALGETV